MPAAQTKAERVYDQVVGWLEHFEPLDDPRQSGKVWYPLDEVLLLCLLAVLAGADGWVEITEFGKAKLAFLRRFRAFARSAGRFVCRARRGGVPAVLHQLGRLADQAQPRHRRHRRQDAQAFLSGGRRQGPHPRDLGMGQHAAPGARP